MKKPKRPPLDIEKAFAELSRFKNFWILDADRVPKVAANIEEWQAFNLRGWEETRRVGETETATMRVSTVFLGVDHNFRAEGPPILFETMVFSLETYAREFEGKIRFSPDDFETRRYSTWDDADTGHKATVRRIQKAEADALARVKSIKEGKEHNGR